MAVGQTECVKNVEQYQAACGLINSQRNYDFQPSLLVLYRVIAHAAATIRLIAFNCPAPVSIIRGMIQSRPLME